MVEHSVANLAETTAASMVVQKAAWSAERTAVRLAAKKAVAMVA